MAGETPKPKRTRGGGFAANPQLAREAGRKGGLKVRDKYGSERYADIGRQGGETVRERYGSEYFREIGSKGGKVSTRGSKAAPEPADGSVQEGDHPGKSGPPRKA